MRSSHSFFHLFLFSLLSSKVPVASWFDDMDDRELLDLIPFLEKLSKVDDIYSLLQKGNKATNNGGGSEAGGVTVVAASPSAAGNPIASVANTR